MSVLHLTIVLVGLHRRFLITSFIVTIAKYVDITTMQSTKNIVKKNIILDSIK